MIVTLLPSQVTRNLLPHPEQGYVVISLMMKWCLCGGDIAARFRKSSQRTFTIPSHLWHSTERTDEFDFELAWAISTSFGVSFRV